MDFGFEGTTAVVVSVSSLEEEGIDEGKGKEEGKGEGTIPFVVSCKPLVSPLFS